MVRQCILTASFMQLCILSTPLLAKLSSFSKCSISIMLFIRKVMIFLDTGIMATITCPLAKLFSSSSFSAFCCFDSGFLFLFLFFVLVGILQEQFVAFACRFLPATQVRDNLATCAQIASRTRNHVFAKFHTSVNECQTHSI